MNHLFAEHFTRDVVSEIQSMFNKAYRGTDMISEPHIRNQIEPFVEKLFEIPNAAELIRSLRNKDPYTYRHCIGVAVVSLGIGTWSGQTEEAVQDLAVAGFLHDIGKIKVDDSILKKAGPLTRDEFSEMSLHTFMGYDILREIPELTEEQAIVALQHHERENGSGYPFGKTGGEMTTFSKIVAIADVFHAMISKRVYKEPSSIYQALKEIHDSADELFDGALVRSFIVHMMKRSIGSTVILSNGQAGRIVKIHMDEPIHPLVRIKGKLCDLRKSRLEIVDFMGVNANVRSI